MSVFMGESDILCMLEPCGMLESRCCTHKKKYRKNIILHGEGEAGGREE